MTKEIRRIYYLVHPFFSVDSPIIDFLHKPRKSKKDAKLDLEYWKATIDRIKTDKSAVLLYVGGGGVSGWTINTSKRLDRNLIKYAQKQLGNRFQARPFADLDAPVKGTLSKKPALFLFGEYYGNCPVEIGSRLAEKLKIPENASLRCRTYPNITSGAPGIRKVGQAAKTYGWLKLRNKYGGEEKAAYLR